MKKASRRPIKPKRVAFHPMQPSTCSFWQDPRSSVSVSYEFGVGRTGGVAQIPVCAPAPPSHEHATRQKWVVDDRQIARRSLLDEFIQSLDMETIAQIEVEMIKDELEQLQTIDFLNGLVDDSEFIANH